MDAEAVAKLMAEQDRGEQEIPAQAPTPPLVTSGPETAPAAPASPPISHHEPTPPAFDPGKVDGRTLRKTGREPFATRIKPETHEALRRIAYTRRITIAEAVEMAVAAFDSN